MKTHWILSKILRQITRKVSIHSSKEGKSNVVVKPNQKINYNKSGLKSTLVLLFICPAKDKTNHAVRLSWVRSSSAVVWLFPLTSITGAAGRSADRCCLSLFSDTRLNCVRSYAFDGEPCLHTIALKHVHTHTRANYICVTIKAENTNTDNRFYAHLRVLVCAKVHVCTVTDKCL